MLRFNLLGFPVRVHWTFWLIAALIGGVLGATGPEQWLAVAAAMAVIFVSILAHELGHALAGRHYGAQPNIMLFAMGGLCYLPGARFSRQQNVVVSLAGPAAGFLLAIITAAVLILFTPQHPLLQYALTISLFVNVVWTMLNLLPILPLDGGQVFRDLLGPSRIQITRTVGAVTAVLLCVVAVTFQFYIAAAIAGVLAYLNFQGKTIEGGVMTSPADGDSTFFPGRR